MPQDASHNISIDPERVTKPTTVAWSATFNGKQARGTLKLKPAMSFRAVPED